MVSNDHNEELVEVKVYLHPLRNAPLISLLQSIKQQVAEHNKVTEWHPVTEPELLRHIFEIGVLHWNHLYGKEV